MMDDFTLGYSIFTPQLTIPTQQLSRVCSQKTILTKSRFGISQNIVFGQTVSQKRNFIQRFPRSPSRTNVFHSLTYTPKFNLFIQFEKLSMSTQQWDYRTVRKTFVDYFVEKQNHTHIPSSKTIPHDDPTLLFANAGMNQFKPLFLGLVGENDTSFLAGLKRAANSQKCIRAGGKHNDLDDVGKDTYHHTFFEMLGNWSFGDYFKEEAIDFAWDLLVNVYKLDPNRIYASYFEGNDSVPADFEAKNVWLKYLPEERILPFSAKENFWEMGETGPCGPCSEIHYDRIGGRFVPELVNMDDPNVIEIWNLVFIQYNREADQSLSKLPARHVDTGMGFERICSILQNAMSNYDTDVFIPIFEEIQRITGARPYSGALGKDDIDGVDTAYRVIADHIRTLTIAIADGGMPSNKDRGYVLRRIVRRAVRFGKQFLNVEPGFFHKLVDVVIRQLGDTFEFPNPERIKQIIHEEEIQFGKTLDEGSRQFEKLVQNHPSDAPKIVSGKDAFDLYQTFGFPVDLTLIMAEEKGFTVDQVGFNEAKEAAAQLSRETRKKNADSLGLQADQTNTLQQKGFKPTEDDTKYQWIDIDASVQAIFSKSGFVESIDSSKFSENDILGLVLDRTSFYAEKGGQIYDTGFLVNTQGGRFEVIDVQTYAGFILHIGYLQEGEFRVGETITTQVDFERRSPIASNHTATHLLNFTLREQLGENIDQEGSLVDQEKLRFDFNFTGSVEREKIEKIEDNIRDVVQKKIEVFHSEQPFEKATRINGVRQMFKAKYPEELVRVISVGNDVQPMVEDPENPQWRSYSVEFCGGTHIYNTSEIEDFAIISETGISRGVRRMTAVTKDVAKEAHRVGTEFLNRLAAAQKLTDINSISQEYSTLSAELEQIEILPLTKRYQITDELKKLFELQKSMQQAAFKTEKAKLVTYVKDIAAKHKESSHLILYMDPTFTSDQDKLMKEAIQIFKKNAPSLPVLIVASNSHKGVSFFKANVPKDISQKLSAKDWLDAAAQASEGKGGGSATFAQGQAKTADHIHESLDAARKFVEAIFGESILEKQGGESTAAIEEEISRLEAENANLKSVANDISQGLKKLNQ